MAKFRDDEDTLENQFIDGELDGNAKNFVDDDDDENIIDEDGNKPFIDDDRDDDDDDFEDDDEDEDDEDNEDLDNSAKGDDKPAAELEDESNEWAVRAQHWKETGRLDPALEIPKGIDQVQLEDLYMSQVEKNVEARFQAKYSDLIEARGIDPNSIFGEEANYDHLALNQCKFVAGLSYDTFVTKSKDIPGDLKAIAQTYHLSRNENLTEKELEAVIKADMAEGTEEELFDKYHSFFTEEAARLETKIKNDNAAASKAATEKAQKDAQYIKEKLGKMGLKEPEVKKVLDGMFVQNQIFDNGKGYRKKVTYLEKVRLESANNIDQQLEMAVNLILKPDPEAAKEKQERVGRLNTLQQLAKLDGGGSGKQSSNSKSQNKKTHKGGGVMADTTMFIPD